MTDSDRFLHRLAAAARRDDGATSPPLPYGFTTRVLARLRDARSDGNLPWESWVRGFAVTAAIAALLSWAAFPGRSGVPDDPTAFVTTIITSELQP